MNGTKERAANARTAGAGGRPQRKPKKKKRRANPALVVLICLCFAVSGGIAAFGALQLWEVNDEIARNAETVRFALRAEEGAEASAPAPDAEAAVRIAHKGRAESELTARAILTLHLEKDVSIAVYDGTGDEALSMGAGRSEGMAELNAVGRCVLHGHRDSAFAPLAHIAPGDRLTLETAEGAVHYTVTDLYVTDPSDPKIYEQSKTIQLALVTCYPFSFVGPAPERLVVVADAEA